METEFNPYASPTSEPLTAVPVAVDVEAAALMPTLPITFRPSAMALFFMIPTGAFMGSITGMFLIESFTQLNFDSFGLGLVALACACLTAFPAFGCLMILRCKIVVNETSIEKIDYPKQTILFSQIESWHHHPVTKTVYISLLKSNKYTPISNWAMTKEKNEILGTVMRAKVGPPSG